MAKEFSDAQLNRLDILQQAAAEFFNVLAETDDVTYELEDIWSLIEIGADLLTSRGRNVRIPTRVTLTNGTDFITDWWNETETTH